MTLDDALEIIKLAVQSYCEECIASEMYKEERDLVDEAWVILNRELNKNA